MKKSIFLILFLLANCAHKNTLEKSFSADLTHINKEIVTTKNPKIIYRYPDPNNYNRMFQEAYALKAKGFIPMGVSASMPDELTKKEMEDFANSKNFEIALFYIYENVAQITCDREEKFDTRTCESVREDGKFLTIVTFFSRLK